jgi:hypothetical protein
MSMLVFWVVTPCGPVGKYQRFGETYCLHLQCFRQYIHDGGSVLVRNVGNCL